MEHGVPAVAAALAQAAATALTYTKASNPMTMYGLILAGGSGTRLWPHSRKGRPKQFLSLGGGPTMLQETASRVLPLIPPERIIVATGAAYADLVAEQLPEVPRENLLIEPMGRGTAPCIGLAALQLLRRDPEAVMAVLSADHRVERPDLFCAQLALGERMAEQGHLVTLGITPDEPATGYGYIERGEPIASDGDKTVYAVRRFVEKPDLATATDYVASGSFVWNAGMFVWRADRIVAELERHRPQVAAALAAIDRAAGTPEADAAMAAIWPGIEEVAIDVAVMERTDRAVVIPSDIGWSDVGDWAALAEVLPRDTAGNALVGKTLTIDTRNTLIYGNGRLVATIGLDDLVIVDTHDVLLICPRERAQDVKAMVAAIRSQHGELS